MYIKRRREGYGEWLTKMVENLTGLENYFYLQNHLFKSQNIFTEVL